MIRDITKTVVLLVSTASISALAGNPRCAGNSEPERCERHQAMLDTVLPHQDERVEGPNKNQQAAAQGIRKKPIVRTGVHIGMSQQDVIASTWGKPHSVNRTTNANGTREQWVYDEKNYLYFDNKILTAIQN